MRDRWFGALCLLLALLWLLRVFLALDPLRTGVAVVLIAGGYGLIRRSAGPRTALVGLLHRLDREYPLHDIALSCGVADVKLDLSRAIIPPGEHRITIRGLVGDVAIYLPYDLEVSVVTTVRAGRVHLVEEGRQGRFFATSGYADAARKVTIAVSLAIGDIDVRYL